MRLEGDGLRSGLSVDGVAPYARHTLWSDPGGFRSRLNQLPNAPATIADTLENFVMHPAMAGVFGCGIPIEAEADKNLRSAERLIEAVLTRFPWARPTSTVLGFPDGRTPTETALAPRG